MIEKDVVLLKIPQIPGRDPEYVLRLGLVLRRTPFSILMQGLRQLPPGLVCYGKLAPDIDPNKDVGICRVMRLDYWFRLMRGLYRLKDSPLLKTFLMLESNSVYRLPFDIRSAEQQPIIPVGKWKI